MHVASVEPPFHPLGSFQIVRLARISHLSIHLLSAPETSQHCEGLLQHIVHSKHPSAAILQVGNRSPTIDPMIMNREECKAIISASLNSVGADGVKKTVDRITSGYTTAFLRENVPGEQLGIEVLWNSIVDAALDVRADNSATQDHLVDLLAGIKTLGSLKRSETGEECLIWGGTLWSDLPMLGVVFRKRWNDAPPATNITCWTNLNAFAARLTVSQVHDFSLYALWAFRDALEVERPRTLRETEHGDQAQKSHDQASLDALLPAALDELLPAAVEWLVQCGPLLLAKTAEKDIKEQEPSQPDPTWLGKLCKDAGVSKTGFSIDRWNFWGQRLHEISEARDDAGGREKVAKIAYTGLQRMQGVNEGAIGQS